MEWLADPTVWAGLLTLVVLEIVLGIDNLIFIAILSDKLPPEQRQRARVLGLTLALGMRIILLCSITWIITLDHQLFSVLDHPFSGRDLIMLFGGAFLIFKATMELHEKLEGKRFKKSGPIKYAIFWHVIVQIIVLDAVFSLDAVITAIGMVEHLEVMIISVCIAMVLMIISSNRLMNFVSAHPTVVILCLGFLLMIGFSLLVEGLGYHIPKGYLYAAIGFSVIIEAFNQTMQRNRKRSYERLDPRTRMSQAVLSILGVKAEDQAIAGEIPFLTSEEQEVFKPQEQLMMRRVLQLSEQSVESIMTPRYELYWIDIADEFDVIMREIKDCPYSCLIVAENGKLEEPLGIVHKKDIANLFLEGKTIKDLRDIIRQPLIIADSITVFQAMETFRKKRMHYAFIIDEYGTLEGFITMTDVAEAIAGDMPEHHEADAFNYKKVDADNILVNGALTVQELLEIVGPVPLPEGDYNTAAGIALVLLKKFPQEGDSFNLDDWTVEIEKMDGRRISRLRFKKISIPFEI